MMRTVHLFALFATSQVAFAQLRMSPMLETDWARLASYPLQVSEGTGAILPGGDTIEAELVVLGGAVLGTGWRPTVKSYALSLTNPNATWRRIKDLPDEYTHQGNAVVGDVLYLCGGYLGRTGHSVAECFGYNHTADDWFAIPSLPGRRAGGGLVYIESMNSLFYAGGALRAVAGVRDEFDFGDSWMLDLGDVANGWVRKADMPNPRNHLSAVSSNGRYFFIGGQKAHDEHRGNQRSNQEYVPADDVWIERAPLPIEMGHAMASTNPYRDGFVMVGGSTRALRLLDHVLYYHISTDSWHFMADYPRDAKSLVCGIKSRQLTCAVGQAPRGTLWSDAWNVTLTELKEFNEFMSS